MMSDEHKSKKERKISLAPLTFDEAVDALLRVRPDEDRPKKKGVKKSPKQDEPERPED